MKTKPKLETDRDVEIKNKAKVLIANAFHMDIQDLYEPLYIVDWWAENERFIEFKARNHNRLKYPTLLLSLHKWMTLHHYVRNGFAAWLCVQWQDGLYYMVINNVSKIGCEYRSGGRTDRNIEGDIEPCVFIPVTKFKRLQNS